MKHLSHRGDPESSFEAAASLNPRDLAAVKEAVVFLLRVRPQAPFQVAELYFEFREIKGWPDVKPDSINKRISDLKREGRLRTALDTNGDPLWARTPFGKRAFFLEVVA